MTAHHRGLLLLFSIVNLLGAVGCNERQPPPPKEVAFEQAPPVTVQPARVEAIGQSSAFSLRWEKPFRGLDDLSFPVGSMHSRVPSAYVTALSGSEVKILSFDTGEVLRSVMLPPELAAIHRDQEGNADPGEFSFSLLGTPEDGVVVASATAFAHFKDGSGSGNGTAIYGCSFDGKLLWCAQVALTHSMIATRLRSGGDLLLVGDRDRILVGITRSGTEAFRVKLPHYENLVLQQASSGELCLLVVGAGVSCYGLEWVPEGEKGGE